MAYPDDPDFTPADTLATEMAAADPKLSVKLEDLATAIGIATTSITEAASGDTPTAAVESATKAKQSIADSAGNAVIVETAAAQLKSAADTWRSSAPLKADIDAAEQAVTDAQQELMDMADIGAANMSTYRDKVTNAQTAWTTMKADRKTADEAYEMSRKQVVDSLGQLKAAADGTQDGTDTGDGTDIPGDDTTTGTGDDTTTPGTAPPSTTGAPSTAAPTATKPTGTPTETAGSDELTDSESDALINALTNSQQQSGQPAASTPAASGSSPAAATPTAQPASLSDAEKDKKNQKTDPITTSDIEQALGLGAGGLATVGLGAGAAGLNAVGKVSPESPRSAPVATQTPIAPTELAATSGSSVSGLSTASDVSGRSTPAATAFTPPAAATNTSGATGNQTGASPLNGRGAGGMGHPMMPPMGVPQGAAAAPTSRGANTKDGEAKKITTYDPNFGGETIADAVRGGTIAQNRDKDT